MAIQRAKMEWRIVQKDVPDIGVRRTIQYRPDDTHHWHEDHFLLLSSTEDTMRTRALAEGYVADLEVIEE